MTRREDGSGALRDDLLGWMRDPAGSPPADGFEGLALRVLRYQARENPVYAALLRSRGLDPGGLDHWTAFPSLPARAFREFPVYCGPPSSEVARFLTSGTTSGAGARGVHRVRDLELYHASLLGQGRRCLRPDLADPDAPHSPMRVLALLPDPARRTDSSLVHMAGVFHEEWDDGGGGFFAGPDWELDGGGFEAALREAAHDGVPALLLGTAFAWVHWLDRASGRPGGGRPEEREGADAGSGPGAVRLPPGSRLLETGGFKGRSRRVARGPLYSGLSGALGIPVSSIVNEYGMTEMLSQFYEPVPGGERQAVEGGRPGGDDAPGEEDLEAALARRRHEGPPWVRTRVLDPVTLAPAADGEAGLLCHLDLANLYSASHLLTEDLGISTASDGSSFRLLGRRPGSPSRGCSLVMEELMEEADG